MDIAGTGSRRVLVERILREADRRTAQTIIGGGAVTSALLGYATVDPLLATDSLIALRDGEGIQATAESARDYVLGISGGFAAIPEVTRFGAADPLGGFMTDARVALVRDGATALQVQGFGANGAGVRGQMASGTLASPSAVSVAGVSYLGFLGGTGYDGTTWQTASAGLFGIKPAATWSGTSRPTLLAFETTAVGSTSRTERWKVTDSGHWHASTDNTYDLGASGANRPRRGYFGTELIAPLATLLNTAAPALVVGYNASHQLSIGVDASDVTTVRLPNATASTVIFEGGDTVFTNGTGGTFFTHRFAWQNLYAGVVGGSSNEFTVGDPTATNTSALIATGENGALALRATANPNGGRATFIAQGSGVFIFTATTVSGSAVDTVMSLDLLTAGAFVTWARPHILPASTTSRSSLRIPSGSAPTSPVSGDEWFDGTTLRFRAGSTSQYASWTRQSAITSPTGGGVIDAEARTAIDAIRAALTATNITA